MDIITRSINDSIAAKQAMLADPGMLELLNKAAEVIISALRSGHRILWCGNGGSAADAQHLAAELSGRFYYDRPPRRSTATPPISPPSPTTTAMTLYTRA